MLIHSRTLRVLLVAARCFPYMGGLETHVYEVGRRLAHAGIQVTILTTDVSGQLPISEQSEGMHIRRVRAWPARKDYYFAPAIYRIIARGQWDLIHCQGYHNLVPPLAMLAARRANIPYVLTFHSAGHSSRMRNALRGLQLRALRPLLSHAKKLIAVTDFEASFFIKHLQLPDAQFTVIPNGMYLPETLKMVESTPRTSDEDFVVVSIGRLERYKGHQRLIAALPKIREHIPNVRVRIVGAGPYEADLRKITRELGVADFVEIGAVPPEDRNGMAALLARADLVTLFSEYESQGITILEALALQRPVLVANTSALREFVERGLACAVPPGCAPEEIARAIVEQLRQPLLPKQVMLPTWDDCATHLLSLYTTIVGESLCVS